MASLPPGSRGAMRLCVNRRSFRHRNGDGCRFGLEAAPRATPRQALRRKCRHPSVAASGPREEANRGVLQPPPGGLSPIRPERHIPNSIATVRRRLIRRSHQHPSEIAAEPPSTDFFRSLLGGQAGLWDAAAFSTRNRASWRASMLRSEEQRSVTVSECAPGRYGRRHSMGWRCSKWRGAGRRR